MTSCCPRNTQIWLPTQVKCQLDRLTNLSQGRPALMKAPTKRIYAGCELHLKVSVSAKRRYSTPEGTWKQETGL